MTCMFPPSATPPSITYYNISGKFANFSIFVCTPQLNLNLKRYWYILNLPTVKANMLQGNIGSMILTTDKQVYKLLQDRSFFSVNSSMAKSISEAKSCKLTVTVDATTSHPVSQSDLDNQVCCLHVLNRLPCQWHSKLRHSGYLEHLNKAIINGIVTVESDCQSLAGRQTAHSSLASAWVFKWIFQAVVNRDDNKNGMSPAN